jgi:hypothetical protein
VAVAEKWLPPLAAKKKHFNVKNTATIILALILAALIYFYIKVPTPTPIKSPKNPIYKVLQNLRMIDAVKEQWALEHNITNGQTILSDEDVNSYLSKTNFLLNNSTVKYKVNSLSQPAEAELTTQLVLGEGTIQKKIYPVGTIIRWGTNEEEFIFPIK